MAKSDGQKSDQLTRKESQAAIIKLERRIEDLESFEVDKIVNRSDPYAEALTQKCNETIAQIYGRNTSMYHQYYVSSFDMLPSSWIHHNQYTKIQIQKSYHEGIKRHCIKLYALKEILEESLSDESNIHDIDSDNELLHRTTTRQVFIVHGSDDGVKTSVARFLEKLDLIPIILHEQANKGQTVIEKFEENATNVDFAIVLLTPDDVGYPQEFPEQQQYRARQNVVLELGYFIASLGRQRVCALYKGNVEIPSDYSGVVYLPLDEKGAWQLSLSKEMKNAGIDIDLNKAVK